MRGSRLQSAHEDRQGRGGGGYELGKLATVGDEGYDGAQCRNEDCDIEEVPCLRVMRVDSYDQCSDDGDLR